MANFFGSAISNSVSEGTVSAGTGGWVALQNGSAPYSGRRWLEIQVKGPTALALSYANKNADSTFTAPTDDVRNHMVIPANSIKIIPAGDGVTVYGRAVAKAGNADNSSKIVIIEFK